MNLFKSLTRAVERSGAIAGTRGYRAYAVGDIHGRLDLLELILERIETDHSAREGLPGILIFLGDLIDRGPGSRAVVERLRNLNLNAMKNVFLLGNHEEVLLRLLRGERGLLGSWLKFGGSEFAQSYGLDVKRLEWSSEEKAIALLRAAVPAEHVRFLESFSDSFRFGDYLFVHAGIRPRVELAVQKAADLRWIRSPFLEDRSDHGFVVVHGHTVTSKVDERPNRIGIDTGAYRSGVLTALAIEGHDRWYLRAALPPACDSDTAVPSCNEAI